MEYKKNHEKLKRSESFFGIHFDFHAGEDCTNIGQNTTEDMLEYIIDTVKPDYVQCDCKGHPGYSSYPTKVANQAHGIKKDSLRSWRDVTSKRNVSLYLHYSGVWDTQAIKHNPSWARIDEKGEIDKNNTSTFGPYADELLIPQLKELCDEYDIDGVWVDGECWATSQDYGEKVIEQFKQQTGIEEIPKAYGEPNFYEFTEFCREAFRGYLRHYIDTMHLYKPGFEIASNWAFTSFMPEPVSADVDFISGDFTLQNSINSARLEARCIAKQGKPWDLMSWAFSSKWGEGCFSIKSPVQLKQEAAIVLSLGGGFQAYFQQKRDASVARWQMKLMAEVSSFCRDRQEICHRAIAVPQIALLLSGTDYYKKNERLFGTWSGILNPLQGALNSLLDSQNCVEVLMEHHMEESMNKYPLIVVPECELMDENLIERLKEYVYDGGSLLVIGVKITELFKDQLNVFFEGGVQSADERWLEYNEWMAGIKAPVQPVRAGNDVKLIGKIFKENDNIGISIPAASIRKMGKGKIAGIYFDYGERYLHAATSTARDFLKEIVTELFPEPVVTVTGSHYVDVVLNSINDKIAVNLINTAGPHTDKDVYVYDDIPHVGPLNVSICYKVAPDKVILEPGYRELDFKYTQGRITVMIDRLEIHNVIIIEP